MVRLKCAICESDQHEKHFRCIGNYDLLRCSKCGLVYISYVVDGVVEGDSFIKSAKDALPQSGKERVEYWSFPHLYRKYQHIFDAFFRERLGRLRKYRRAFRSMLDIGCGYGFWMKFCQDRGIDVYGLDSSPEVVGWARKNLALTVENISLEEFNSGRNYDTIVLCDILEHLVSPNQQLKKIRDMLSKDGLIYIQVPNVLGFKLPPGHGHGLPHHLWQFSYRSLKRLLEKNGFKVLNHWTGASSVIGIYEKGGPSFRMKVYWKLARALKLGNRLQVLAKKQKLLF